jgi:hypothetical protein
MEMAPYGKDASVRPNEVGELLIRERFDRLCFKDGV